LTPSEERALKKELKKLWMIKDNEGNWAFNGPQIAKMLGFGVPGSPYVQLKPEYVYNYRQKFNLPIRFEKKHYPHRYAHGKQEEPLELSEWIDQIDQIPSGSFHGKRKRSFNALVFWTGLRNTEMRILTPDDIEIESDRMIIHAFRLKKSSALSVKDRTYDVELRLEWMFVEEIYDWVKRFETDDIIWNVSRWSAWSWVKEIYPEGYPHMMRLNRITAMCSDPRFSIAEIRAWSGLHISTIEAYISKSGRFVTTAADKMTQIMSEGKDDLGGILKQLNNLSEEDKRKVAKFLE
jgi:hypothetical protein